MLTRGPGSSTSSQEWYLPAMEGAANELPAGEAAGDDSDVVALKPEFAAPALTFLACALGLIGSGLSKYHPAVVFDWCSIVAGFCFLAMFAVMGILWREQLSSVVLWPRLGIFGRAFTVCSSCWVASLAFWLELFESSSFWLHLAVWVFASLGAVAGRSLIGTRTSRSVMRPFLAVLILVVSLGNMSVGAQVLTKVTEGRPSAATEATAESPPMTAPATTASTVVSPTSASPSIDSVPEARQPTPGDCGVNPAADVQRLDPSVSNEHAAAIIARAMDLPLSNTGCPSGVEVGLPPALVGVWFRCPASWPGCQDRLFLLDRISGKVEPVFGVEPTQLLPLLRGGSVDHISPRHTDGFGFMYLLFLGRSEGSCRLLAGTHGSEGELVDEAAQYLVAEVMVRSGRLPWLVNKTDVDGGWRYDLALGHIDASTGNAIVEQNVSIFTAASGSAAITYSSMPELTGLTADSGASCRRSATLDRITRVP